MASSGASPMSGVESSAESSTIHVNGSASLQLQDTDSYAQEAPSPTNGHAVATPGGEQSSANGVASTAKDNHHITDTSTPRGTPRGRGRGRGGKRMSLPTDPANASSPSATTPRGSLRGRGARGRGSSRGGRGGRGGKRRRDEDEIKAGDSPSDSPSDDDYSSDTPTTATATRSGRAVQKPSAFTPVPPNAAAASGSPSAAVAVGVKRKRRAPGRNPELAVCSVCLRPHSPSANMIVFCDGCNTPWHRYCHHPPIEQVVVDVPDREWYCAECAADHRVRYDVALFRSGEGVGEEKKRAHLTKLPAPVLIDLLLRASSLHPSIPLLPPDPARLAAHLASMPPPPPPPAPSAPPRTQLRPPDDELEPAYAPDPPAHYPRAGHGLARTLGPESADEDMLVDGNDEVYTHLWQADARAANEGVYGAVGKEAVAVDADADAQGGADEEVVKAGDEVVGASEAAAGVPDGDGIGKEGHGASAAALQGEEDTVVERQGATHAGDGGGAGREEGPAVQPEQTV